ncbi:DNA (cytosine-5-)-methyltransferase [Leuconostoc mesenteroides]|uniref:DNA (cytosine-5-)-methyltransferase n=1 Tax=Leuconostoc mesenteroides TaxID=1245 RepID=UPI0006A0B0AF|nr:DNA (cytosine-5-)-methyltransferase [Leuconostoc mesenteroides]KMY77152.1 DNA (cytosine-5-)-methyltransferase [Leuconostoc mesenteroides subsp. mesenteroides]
MDKVKVAEMFAGVGGFHLGLSRASDVYEVVWADQFEPARKNQFAYNIYKTRFPNTNIVNQDISLVNKFKIPDMDLLVGGFPCQDYSVASSSAMGLYGKKGVLWWDIKDVIEAKWPKFIFLENVDRLLTSPGTKSGQPGRDFGMILRTLSDLGYGVTWKMINAADYGYPQRRRRTFIFAVREDTKFKKTMNTLLQTSINQIDEFILNMPPLSNSLKNQSIGQVTHVNLNEITKLSDFSNDFKINRGFRKTGFMIDGQVYMADFEPDVRQPKTLKNIIEPNNADETLYLTKEMEEKFEKLKGGFRTTKISKTGYEYPYGMGKIAFPDSLDYPARTMVTSEHTVSRMSHVVRDPGNNKLRLISPEEAEQINTFPAGWTSGKNITPSNRYFTMGNALVVDLVKEISEQILYLANLENKTNYFKSDKKVEKVIHN